MVRLVEIFCFMSLTLCLLLFCFLRLLTAITIVQVALCCMEVNCKRGSVWTWLELRPQRISTCVLWSYGRPPTTAINLHWKRDQLTWFVILVASWCDVPLVPFARMLTELLESCSLLFLYHCCTGREIYLLCKVMTRLATYLSFFSKQRQCWMARRKLLSISSCYVREL